MARKKNTGIRMNDKALLFINGVPPNTIPDFEGYGLVACSDGALHYLKKLGFPMEKLAFISGDFDSHSGTDDSLPQDKFIYTLDQDKTDFHKSLEIILYRGYKTVDVYGGSGGEMDHFLGNLHTALAFKDALDITFYDEFSRYFFAPKNLVLTEMKGRLVSLFPVSVASNIRTEGLNWELNGEDLSVNERIGTRNFALKDKVRVQFSGGELVVFVGHQPMG